MVASVLGEYVWECYVLIEHYVFDIVGSFKLVFRMGSKAVAKFLIHTGYCCLYLLIFFSYFTLI